MANKIWLFAKFFVSYNKKRIQMSQLLVANTDVVLPDRVLKCHSVLCEDGRIKRIAPAAELKAVTGAEIIDANGKYLAPGFIDLHIHGLHDFLIDDGIDNLPAICKLLPQYGVTGFLPTVCPLPKGKDAAFLANLAKAMPDGAAILGFHLEGPFLAMTGALPPEALGKADAKRVKALIEAARPYKAIFSVSPDFEDICDLLPIMSAQNTPVFITHTTATVKQTQAAIEAGVCHATHFYDVFPCPPVTDPGVRPCGAVEAVLADPRVSVDFILDGEHVDPVAVKMALRCKGPDRVCLITDANKGAGLPPGRYKALGAEVDFKYPGAPARLTENTLYPGCLAGSGLTMDRAVRNAIKMLNVNVPLAIRMASTNPAQVLRLTAKGQIKEGFDADLVLLDNSLNVCTTWTGGVCQYSKK
jgi:N-acetylglucosamine-6-phosphate deacetylase